MGKEGPQGIRGDASVEFLKPLRLCLVATLVAAGLREQVIHSVPRSFASPWESVHLVVPEQGAFTGAYMDFGETEDDVTLEKIEAFEQAAGKHQASSPHRVTGERKLFQFTT